MATRRAGRARRRAAIWLFRLGARVVAIVALAIAAGVGVDRAGFGRGTTPSASMVDQLVSIAGDGVVALVVVAGGAMVALAAWRIYRRVARSRIADWRDAEAAAASWLRRAGCRGVALTGAGADGGIDVVSTEWAVQVKHTANKVGRPAVQQLVGAALALERSPALFSTGGFTAPARAYADQHDVALVELGLDGRARPLNRPARRIGRRNRWPFAVRIA